LITCQELFEFILGYLEGELPEPQVREFEAHLAVCPSCVRYLESYEETVRLGREACQDRAAELPADVPEDLVRAVQSARRRAG
jgi:anti-sigma factor RsiW